MAFKTAEREVYSHTVNTVVPAASGDVDIVLGAGAWKIALHIVSSVTGTTTTVGAFALGPNDEEPGLALYMIEQNDTAPIAAATLPAGANVDLWMLIGEGVSIQSSGTSTLVNKLRLTITKGGASTGEVLQIHVVATRM